MARAMLRAGPRFLNAKKWYSGDDNLRQIKLNLLKYDLGYKTETPHRKESEKKSQSSRPINLMLKMKTKKI